MVAGAIGAILGDSSLFWIARKSSAKMQPHLDKALEDEKVRIAWDALNRSPGLLIVAGRYVPGMRFVVECFDGALRHPLPPLLRLVGRERDPLVGCTRARWPTTWSTSLSGYPLASLIISSLITAGALALVFYVARSKKRKAEAAAATDAGSGPPGRNIRIRRVRAIGHRSPREP